MTRPNCKARQYSDQMVCNECDLAWDVNDQDPPACRNGPITAAEVLEGQRRRDEASRIRFVEKMKRKRFW